MQITNFRVAFKRACQQAQYEGETYGLVEFAGTVDEGENAYEIAARGLEKARAMALASVGKAPKTKEGEDTYEIAARSLEKARAMALSSVGKAPKTKEGQTCETTESSSEKPTGGKPKGSQSKSAKKSSKSEQKAKTAESDEPERPGSGGGSDAGGEEAVSDADLMEAANVAAKKHTGGRVKRLMQEEFGVTMLRDIPEKDRPKFQAALRALDKED